MDVLLAHLQDNAPAYIIVAVVLAPIVYMLRRYVVPAIAWSAEIAVYSAAFHLVLYGLIRAARWFNMESQMTMVNETKSDPGWKTPLLEFWDLAQYQPSWVAYLEIAAVGAFAILVIRMRPMKTQKVKPPPPPKRKTNYTGSGTDYGGPGNR